MSDELLRRIAQLEARVASLEGAAAARISGGYAAAGSALAHQRMIERFWSKVNKDGPVPPHRPELGQCWVWAARVYNGYGAFQPRHGRMCRAHRVAWEIASGAIPPGLFVLHRCDNRLCVRPEHLETGTHVENMADMKRKGRGRGWQLFGERHHNSKLSTEDVELIRLAVETLPVTRKDVALAWGISASQCSNIVLGKQRNHG